MNRDFSRVSWVDYLLSFFAGTSALYSAGMGLGIAEIGYFCVGIFACGSLFSFLVHSLLKKTIVPKFDGLLFAIAGFAVIFNIVALNRVLPEGGFPNSLMIASVLCWLMMVWSFAMWRDSTLMFPCVPAVAIFSLVGSWDNFGGAVFAFFVFLLCFATLFARAQQRGMVYRAHIAGETDPSRLKLGPWKWMAGPEWALASAAVVVLVSLLGAPIIQFSVQGVAGFVRITAPSPQRRPNTQNPLNSSGDISGEVGVGRGPRGDLSRAVVLRAKMDEPRYLRSRTFVGYTGRGWRPMRDFNTSEERRDAWFNPESLFNVGRDSIKDYRTVPFTIEFVGTSFVVPMPGELHTIQGRDANFEIRPDGTVIITRSASMPDVVGGWVRVPDPYDPPVNASTKVRGAYVNERGTDSISPRVRQLALEVTADATTDYEKAMAIKREIEKRCRYNLNAPAVSARGNAVEEFLFVTQEGYCDLFASAMVVMSRAVGLPARYTNGFLPFPNEVDDLGRYIVRESDYHAWCEILFEEKGWTIFDATEGAVAVPGGERGRPTASEPIWQRDWFKGVLAFLALGFISWSGWLVRSRYAATRAKLGVRGEVGILYEKFARRLERIAGKPRWPSQTPDEYLELCAPLLAERLEEARDLNRLFVESMFSPTSAALVELKSRVKAFGKRN